MNVLKSAPLLLNSLRYELTAQRDHRQARARSRARANIKEPVHFPVVIACAERADLKEGVRRAEGRAVVKAESPPPLLRRVDLLNHDAFGREVKPVPPQSLQDLRLDRPRGFGPVEARQLTEQGRGRKDENHAVARGRERRIGGRRRAYIERQ